MKYLYRCRVCGEEVEFDYSMGQAPNEVISSEDDCGASPHTYVRQFTTAGVIFKGPGFYSTDHHKSPIMRGHH